MALAMTKGDRAADTAWHALTHELDRWLESGRTATFWWRDDDACDATPALEALLTQRDALGVPLALAVVPATATPALRERLNAAADVAVLQHGYSHKNFAHEGERKIELDGSRPAAYVIGDLATGAQALAKFSGHLPVLVPPWNRIAPHLLPFLPEIGITGLSTLGARTKPMAFPGLTTNNVHIDPIDWRGKVTGHPGSFAGVEATVESAVAHLAARRTGEADAGEATGLMTHHAVMETDSQDFVAELVSLVRDHPAANWLSAGEIFTAP